MCQNTGNSWISQSRESTFSIIVYPSVPLWLLALLQVCGNHTGATMQDNLTVMASSRERKALTQAELLTRLPMLDFTINWKNSSPFSHYQTIIYLGVYIKSLGMRAKVFLCQALKLSLLFCRASHPAEWYPLCWWYVCLVWYQTVMGWSLWASFTWGGCDLDLSHWKAPHVLSLGVPFGRVALHILFYIDASLFGCGGKCLSPVFGRSGRSPQFLHINCLELSTVLNTLFPCWETSMWWSGQTTKQHVHKPLGWRSFCWVIGIGQKPQGHTVHKSVLHQNQEGDLM